MTVPVFDNAPDPITAIAQRLVAVLKGSSNFMELAGKIEDMTAPAFERFKTEIQAGDLPEVAIVQGAFSFDPFGPNSKVAMFTQQFKLVMVMESLKSPPLNQLKMVLMGALADADPQLGLDGLVFKWECASARDDAFGPKEWTRETVRFLSFMDIVVTFYLPNAALQQMGQ